MGWGHLSEGTHESQVRRNTCQVPLQDGSRGILLLVFIACLSIFGVETTTFAAVLGSAGIAIALAFQGTLGNFASGIMLLMFRPYQVGDVVTIDGVTGKVNEIALFTTTLDSFDNRRFIMKPTRCSIRITVFFGA